MKKTKNGVGGGSFIASGIIVAFVPAILYILFGDFVSLLGNCSLPFSSVNVDGTIINCMEIRFIYVLSYFCILLGLILVILGLAKKILEVKK